MKTIAQLETESNAAHQTRDAADKREAALHAFIAACRAVSLATDDLTGTDRENADAAEIALRPRHVAALKAVNAVMRERAVLDAAVADADHALNDAAEVAA